jgi:hypothetical protein
MPDIISLLDPFQWVLLISALIAFFISGVVFFGKDTGRDERLTSGLLCFFNFYAVLRYVVVIIFKWDFPTLNPDEIYIVNLLGQILIFYVILISLYSSVLVLWKNHKLSETKVKP